MSIVLSSAAVKHVVNYNEHIARNFQPVLMRLFTLRMKRNQHFLATDDTIGKLCNHIFKRLGNMQTFWPPTVPRNHANVDQVDRLINIYKGWFQILESEEALEMMKRSKSS